MKDSIKANLIIFFIIAIIAFSISTSFASLTVKENTDSYKLLLIENNSFEPNHVEEVPYLPLKTTNVTNATDNNTANNDTIFYNTTGYSEYW